jgi:hypothetical protein
LSGVKFHLDTIGTLHSLNLFGRNTGAQVKMAVYNDNKGVPSDLIVNSNTVTVNPGLVSLPVFPTILFPGDYWIMALYDRDGRHTYTSFKNGSYVYYNLQSFNDSIPKSASEFSFFTNNTAAYFLEISCGVVDVLDADSESNVHIIRNPVISSIYLSHIPEDVRFFEIYDFLGIKRIEGNIEMEINIEFLSKGIYFLKLNNQPPLKFIKL